MTEASHRIVLIHTIDPRGMKLGGIETHVRLVLARHPASASVLLIGIDESGDLAIGKTVPITHAGRRIDFLPVMHVPSDTVNAAATSIGQSVTLRFLLALLRHLPTLRRAIRGRAGSVEIERFEFAIIPKLLGLPSILLVHNEGTRGDKMDSLLKRYWFLHRLNERIALRLADRIVAVNAAIAARVASLSAAFVHKTEVMSVSVDTATFAPAPFPRDDDAFHVCFAGRLDEFKDPPLMFATIARLDKRLREKSIGRFARVRFHYVGASDPHRFPAFDQIDGLTVRHGIRRADEVADVMREAHAGLITSFFEGMPCYLMEMIASGRPVVAVDLPQFASVIVPGTSGALVPRLASPDQAVAALVFACLGLAEAIDAGTIDPDTIATLAIPFSVDVQMARLFDAHHRLAR